MEAAPPWRPKQDYNAESACASRGPSNIVIYPFPRPIAVKKRPGFSLVLTLIIVALLTLTVLLSAAFINIESRLAMQQHLATRARMNAVSSLRLAMAHLQQEAGPDRRMTARADITADKLQPGWNWSTIRNPLWTGVWRSDRPLQPPAWLVSGRHDRPAGAQSVSLFGVNLSNVANYDGLALAPWDRTYAPPAQNLVTLVGDASASGPINQSGPNPGKPDGRIRLPRVPLPDQGVNGNYAYWIGDEGVKARINLRDPRLDPDTATDQIRLKTSNGIARSGLARSSVEILGGFNASKIPAAGLDTRYDSFRTLSIQDSATNTSVITETNPPSVARRLFTETTFWSRGVNCDSQFGGLKIDLSSAFELDDDKWANTEFAAGDLPYDSNTPRSQLSGVVYGLNGDNLVGATNTTAWTDNKANGLRSVYCFKPVNGTRADELARGPTWDSLRNYYLLYKEIDWSNPSQPKLNARAHFPNNAALDGYLHYGDRYNFTDTPTEKAFLTLDRFNVKGLGVSAAPKPTKVAVTPYVARLQLIWGLTTVGTAGNARVMLTLTPIVVLHNPYNVALNLKNMRISFNEWQEWCVEFKKNPLDSKSKWEQRTMADLYRASRPGSLPQEIMHIDIPQNTIIGPGELKVFASAKGLQNLTDGIPTTLSNEYNDQGGFSIGLTDTASKDITNKDTESLEVVVDISEPNTPNPRGFRPRNKIFGARVKLVCWGNDSLANTTSTCSEINQLRADGLHRSGTTSPRMYPIRDPQQSGLQPTPLALFDYGIRWPNNRTPNGQTIKAAPLFTYSNPMAAVTRADAACPTSALTPNYAGTSISYNMDIRNLTSLTDNDLEEEEGAAYGGLSVKSVDGGQKQAVYTEVPFSPPLSIAQLSHANFTLRDQEPLLAIGNSFRPLNQAHNAMSNSLNGLLTTWDHSWMLNSALFDRFYFSGAASDTQSGSSRNRNLEEVLNDFVAGVGTLSNPRTTLYSNRDPDTVRAMVGNHRRIAGATLTEGAFNVNSTSVEAWTMVLSGARKKANEYNMPRALRAETSLGFNYKSEFNRPEAWTGLTSLDDNQIRLLAKSIVAEIRVRAGLYHRSPRGITKTPLEKISKKTCDVDPYMDIPVPFFGLAQFVNRNLCGEPTGWTPTCSVFGSLQAAVIRADVENAAIWNRPTKAPGSNEMLQGSNPRLADTLRGQSPWVQRGFVTYPFLPNPNYNPFNPADRTRLANESHAHLLAGAPASLTQADILAAIGPGLTTRSDTFVIRCYGDALNQSGETGGRCWIEAIVQRTPEFCDSSQAPETEVCDPANCFNQNPRLSNVNRTLGRRFQIVSMRALTSQEL